MPDTLTTIYNATIGALKLKHVTSGSPSAGQGTLEKCLDGSELRVSISGLPGGSALSWTAPTLLNSWVNYDAANYANAGYAKTADGIVHLRGSIKDGVASAGTTLFTLPTGFRPTKRHQFAVVADGAIEVVDVATNGDVVLGTASSATWLSLSGIAFSVD